MKQSSMKFLKIILLLIHTSCYSCYYLSHTSYYAPLKAARYAITRAVDFCTGDLIHFSHTFTPLSPETRVSLSKWIDKTQFSVFDYIHRNIMNIEPNDQLYHTLMMQCVKEKRYTFLFQLLEKNNQISFTHLLDKARGNYDYEALFILCNHIVKNQINSELTTVFNFCASQHKYKLCKLCLQGNVDLSQEALFVYNFNKSDFPLIKLIFNKLKQEDQQAIFIRAAKSNFFYIARYCVKNNLDLNKVIRPLSTSCNLHTFQDFLCNNHQIIPYLLQGGIRGENLLIPAIQNNHIKWANKLESYIWKDFNFFIYITPYHFSKLPALSLKQLCVKSLINNKNLVLTPKDTNLIKQDIVPKIIDEYQEMWNNYTKEIKLVRFITKGYQAMRDFDPYYS